MPPASHQINVLLVAANGVILASPGARVAGVVTAGAALGVVGGLLQGKAARQSAPAMISARTAMDVRRALMATRWGRVYIYLLWTDA